MSRWLAEDLYPAPVVTSVATEFFPVSTASLVAVSQCLWRSSKDPELSQVGDKIRAQTLSRREREKCLLVSMVGLLVRGLVPWPPLPPPWRSRPRRVTTPSRDIRIVPPNLGGS